ncbi:hypothetical protein [Larkinella soli]|uniref:hypothetical protein n=1 Tax=Larkinella soli TaxID=1770527 RepID=UPI000FFB9F59|nr:hypothetical protein [Larkinella soli]
MRAVLLLLAGCLSAGVGFAQDSIRKAPTTIAPVVTPSNSAPLTSPAADPTIQTGKGNQSGGRKRRVRTVPPSDPNAFGVGVTIEKADSTRRKRPKD